jgi:Holliday junction DNA helicase RuvA
MICPLGKCGETLFGNLGKPGLKRGVSIAAATIGGMIAHLRGRLLSKAPNQAVVECGGVGYDVTISIATFTELPAQSAEVALHVYTNVREDQIALFGFSDRQEKKLFEKLIGVSGIGPKLAITVLSGISAERLVGAIRGNDLGMLTKVPGIGKKTAERVVLELKDKLDDLVGIISTADGEVRAVSFGAAGDDALSALVNLGYARPAAQKALEGVAARHPELKGDFEGLFRAAMGSMR